MADSDKDILITPNTGQIAKPKIEVTGADNSTKTITINDDGTLSFDSTIAATTGSIADGNANLVTGDAVFDYIAAQNFATSGASNFVIGDITGQTELTSGLASTDELVLSDAGALKRMDISVLQSYMQSNLTFTTDTILTTENVQDIVGAMFTGNTETRVSATYEDGDGTIDLVVDDMTADTNTFRTVTAGGNTLGASETLAFTAGSNVTITELDGAVTIASTDTNTPLTLLDEDDMSSNSATAAASQQSIKAYVDSEVSGLVDSAPSALDTLNELAAALGDDASFSTTTATSLGNRLRVDVNTQGLTSTQQGNALTNLGITATLAEINILDDGLAASDIPNLATSKITSGTFADARIAESNVTQHLAAGTGLSLSGKTFSANLSASDIPNLAASKITSGTFATARIADDAITEAKLSTTNTAVDDYLLSFDSASGGFTWVAAGAGGENNQNAFSNVAVSGQTTAAADSATDTLTLVAAGGMTITTSGDSITLNSANTNTQNTYTSSFVDSSNDILLRLTEGGAGSGTQDIKFVAGSNITLTHTDANNITIASTDTNTNTQLSEDQVEDIVGGLIVGGTNVTATYDDTAGTLTLASTDTNTQLSNAQVVSALNSDLGGDIVFGTQTDDNVKYTGSISVGNVNKAGSALLTADGFATMNGLFLGYGAGPGYIKTYNSSDNLELYAHSGTAHVKMLDLDAVNNKVIVGSDLEVGVTGTAGQIYLSADDATSYLSWNATGTDVTLRASDDLVLRADDDIFFKAGGVTKMYLLNDGKLGIGTSSPATTLDVAGDISGDRLNLEKSDGYASLEMGGSSGAFIDMKNPFSDDFDVRFITTGTNLDIITSNASSPITLKTQGTTRLTVADAQTTVANNLVVSGDLTVSGTTTTLNTDNLNVEDNTIVLNDGESGAGITAGTAGIEIDRGTATNATLLYDESIDGFVLDSKGTGRTAKFVNQNGYIELGPQNTSYAHISTDRARFYFNRDLVIGENAISSYNGDFSVRRSQDSSEQIVIGDNSMTFTSAGNDVVTIDGTNTRLGIGTASPDAALHVQGGANDEVVALFTTAGGTSGTVEGIAHLGLSHFSSDTVPSVSITAEEIDDSDHRADFRINTRTAATANAAPTEKMRVTYDGKVGIGTTSPAKELDVAGDIQLSGSLFINDGTDLAPLAPTYVQVYNTDGSNNATVKMFAETWGGKAGTTSSDDFFIIAHNSDRMQFDGSMRTTFYGSASADPIIRLTTKDTSVSNTDDLGVIEWLASYDSDAGDTDLIAASISAVAEADFTATANTTGLVFKTATSEAATEKMRITNDGKVGIGTTSPAHKLDVDGNLFLGKSGETTALTGAPQIFVQGDSALATFTADNASSGDQIAGIRVFGDSYRSVGMVIGDYNNTTGATTEDWIFGRQYASTNKAGIFAAPENGGDEYLTANSDGQKAVKIAGDNDDIDFIIHGSSGEYFRAEASTGRVGIGTTSPDTLFEIKEGGSGAAVMRLRNSNTSFPDDTAFGRIEFYNADASGAGITAQIEAVSDASGRGGQLAFKTDDTGTSPSTAMFIQGDGKVGIGTTNASTTLHVQSATAGVLIESTATSGEAPILDLYKNDSGPAVSEAIGTIKFSGENDQDQKVTYAEIQSYIEDETDATENAALQFFVQEMGTPRENLRLASNQITFNNSERDVNVLIKSDDGSHNFFSDAGNNRIGIGTNTPSTKLDVSGSVTLTGLVLDGNTITGVDDSGEFTNDDGHIMTSAAIEDKILGYGYTTGMTFIIEDDDGTEVSISNAEEIKFLSHDGSMTIDWTDIDNGSDSDPFDVDFRTAHAPYLRTSDDRDFAPEDLANTIREISGRFSTKTGLEDGSTTTAGDYVDVLVLDTFTGHTGGDANLLAFAKNSTKRIYHYRADQDDTNWGTASTIAYTSDVPTIEDIQDIVGAMFSSNTETNITATYQDADGTIDLVGVAGDITGVTAGTGLTGGGSSGDVTLNVIGGTGITANANDVAVTAAQTGITSIFNTSLAIGYASSGAKIQFNTDNQISFAIDGTKQINLLDGALTPQTDNDVDLGSSSLKYRGAYLGLVDAENIKVNGGQGTDGQVLTSTGSGVAWENATGGSSAESDGSKPVVYMDSGNTDVDQTERTIPFDTEVLDPSGNASKGTDGHIRIVDAGYYEVSYSLPINDDGSTLADRTRVFAVAQTASNDSFSSNLATIAQSRSQVYTREASGGSGLSASFIYEHTANDYIRIRIDAENNTNISTETNQSQISIRKLSTPADREFVIQAAEADQYISSTAGAGNANGFFPGYGDGERNTTQSSTGADIGFPIPKNCELKEIYMSFGNAGSETNSSNQTITVFKNRAASTTTFTYNASGSGGNQFSKEFTSFSGNGTTYSAGDTFNLRATGLSGYTDTQVGPVRIAVVFRET